MPVRLTAHSRSQLSVAVLLNAEWEHVAPAPVPQAWSGAAAFAGLPDAAAVLAAVRDRLADPQRSEQLLAHLVAQAGGEGPLAQLAARIALQAMLGKAVRIARSLSPYFDTQAEAADHVVSCLYEVIVSGRAACRDGSTAANLALDTLKLSRATAVPVSAEATGDAYHPAAAPLSAAWSTPAGPEDAALARDGLSAAVDLGIVDADDDLAKRAVLNPDPGNARGQLVELLTVTVQARLLTPADARLLAGSHAGAGDARSRQRRSRAIRRLSAAIPALCTA